MPVPMLKILAKKSGKSLSDAEKYWENAKIEASKKFDKKDNRYWAYVTGIVKHRLGLNESISFKNYLKESEDEYEHTFKMIKKNCGQFLRESGELPVYRGMDSKSLVDVFETLKYRRPKDSSKLSTILFNLYIEDITGIKNIRTEHSLFGTGCPKHARGYGTVYFIFPIDKFEFVWSPDMHDLYDEWSARSIARGPVSTPNAGKYVKALDELETNLASKRNFTLTDMEENTYFEEFKMIKKPTYDLLDKYDYTDRNLGSAISAKNEIMFQTKGYYGLEAFELLYKLKPDTDRSQRKIDGLKIAYKILLEKLDEI